MVENGNAGHNGPHGGVTTGIKYDANYMANLKKCWTAVKMQRITGMLAILDILMRGAKNFPGSSGPKVAWISIE